MTRNWEDWTFGLSLATAIVVGATLSARAPTFATEAVAAEPADYVMTITAKRLPPECKSVAGARSAYCQALMNEATVTVR